jgi:hypothetical protein
VGSLRAGRWRASGRRAAFWHGCCLIGQMKKAQAGSSRLSLCFLLISRRLVQ